MTAAITSVINAYVCIETGYIQLQAGDHENMSTLSADQMSHLLTTSNLITAISTFLSPITATRDRDTLPTSSALK